MASRAPSKKYVFFLSSYMLHYYCSHFQRKERNAVESGKLMYNVQVINREQT